MATTIYKVSKYKNWQSKGVELSSSTIGGGTTNVDLSNYYTKSELQTVNLSIVNSANVKAAPFQTIAFASPLEIDATTYKDWVTEAITGNTTINLNNTINGDAGMLVLVVDSSGGYTITLGTMFTDRIGSVVIAESVEADAKIFISWRNVLDDIMYTIAYKEV